MAITVRQVGGVAPPLKSKIEQFQQAIDSNEQLVHSIRGQLQRMEEGREKLAISVQERQDDRRNLYSSLMRLEDALASFGVESKELETAIEEIPRILERVSLPANQEGAMALAGADAMLIGAVVPAFGASRRIPAAAIDVPLPYFETLARKFEDRTQQVWERVNAVEAALVAYGRQTSGVPVESQIEAVVRSQHAQFRTLAAQVAQTADRLEQLREVAVRTKGVPAGMLARPGDNDWRDAAWTSLDRRGLEGSILLGAPLLGVQPLAGAAALGGGMGMLGMGPGMGAGMGAGMGIGGMGGMGGGLFGQNTGGGLFGQGAVGGMLGQNPGGGLFGQNTGGGLFGQPAGGGMFGQPGGGMLGQPGGGGLFGQNTGGGLFGQNTGGGLFGQPAGGGMFGQNTGGGLFGQPAGGGLFGQPSGGGLFGQNTGGGMFGGGGGMFGQNTGGGMFGQNTGGGLFGQPAGGGGGLFGQNTGGGLFGQNTGGGMFGQNTGGGMFGQPAGGGMFGQNTGGGMFGQNTGGGLFGQNTGGGMFGQSSGGGLFGGGGGLFGR